MTENMYERGVSLANGSTANFVGPTELIEAMYPVGLTDTAPIYLGQPVVDANGIELKPVNSVLRFEELEVSGRTAVTGNTVTRGCPVAEDCGSCALAGVGLEVSEMVQENCARANTAASFELAEQAPEGRFVLLPTSKESYVVDDDSFTSEFNGYELLQSRLKPAMAVVFTGSWLKGKDLDQITVGMNGADGSMGVLTAKVPDEVLIVPFCSMRQNMGDRGEAEQILRQALTAYFDKNDFSPSDRYEALRSMHAAITLGASASLKNFAHKIKVPSEDADAPERERKDAARLRKQYPDLIQRAGGKITSAIVLNDQYPGAMERGSIFPQFEAEMGIHTSPITPDNCPGDGQTCHVDYRTETEYALVGQLEAMGVPAANIKYDDSQALDPASPSNKMASNRAEQNNGIEVGDTSRTINAVAIRL